MNQEPTFGNFDPEVDYRRRAGAYAVIFDEQGRFASVKARRGFFLPGGGIETGESLEETLAREVREECAHEVKVGRFLGSAIQYHRESDGSRHWEFHCSYFAAEFGSPLDNEPEHELIWLELSEAENLKFDVHRWGVNRRVQQDGI
jgi:8-oxo-dGTP diphosphatase